MWCNPPTPPTPPPSITNAHIDNLNTISTSVRNPLKHLWMAKHVLKKRKRKTKNKKNNNSRVCWAIQSNSGWKGKVALDQKIQVFLCGFLVQETGEGGRGGGSCRATVNAGHAPSAFTPTGHAARQNKTD